MFVRKTVNAFAGTAALGLGVVVLATPSYANTTVQIIGTFDEGTWSDVSVSPGAVFDQSVTVSFDLTGISEWEFDIVSDQLFSNWEGTDCSVDEGGCFADYEDSEEVRTFTVNPSAVNATVEVIFDPESASEDLWSFTVSYAVPSDGSVATAAGPAPHIQQFAMPETGTCDAAQPEGLNWGGVASGGWGESWAQWMNDGAGGDVCTRTLAFNTSTAAWEVE